MKLDPIENFLSKKLKFLLYFVSFPGQGTQAVGQYSLPRRTWDLLVFVYFLSPAVPLTTRPLYTLSILLNFQKKSCFIFYTQSRIRLIIVKKLFCTIKEIFVARLINSIFLPGGGLAWQLSGLTTLWLGNFLVGQFSGVATFWLGNILVGQLSVRQLSSLATY